MPSTTSRGLDPRAPLVLDTRELGRRPGTQRTRQVRAEAPADLGIEVLRVPEGAPVDIELRLEAVVEGVLVTATAHAELEGECVRCLESLEDEIEVDWQELYLYDDPDSRDRTRARAGAADAEVGDDEEAVRRMEGDLVDLEPALRDAVVLALPFQPLCRPDCPGLCAECGARLADDPQHTHDAAVDPRWAGLQQLGDQLRGAR